MHGSQIPIHGYIGTSIIYYCLADVCYVVAEWLAHGFHKAVDYCSSQHTGGSFTPFNRWHHTPYESNKLIVASSKGLVARSL